MSAIALVFGVAMYLALQRRFNLHLHHPPRLDRALDLHQDHRRPVRVGRAFHGAAGNRLLAAYAAWMVGTAIVAAAFPFVLGQGAGLGTGSRSLLPASPVAVVAWALLLAAGTALVLTHHDRFRAVVLVGVVGLVTSLTFVALSAPDLALTQLSVEVVSTVLLLMGLALLPQTSPRESSALRRGRDAALALAGGGGWPGSAG